MVSGHLYLDLGGDHRDTILLAGSGRSGTTFVSGAVASAGRLRYIFEPFHPGRVGPCGVFERKQYLHPDDMRTEYVEAARKVLSGGIRSGWTDRFNRESFPCGRVVKDIRANLMLGWLHARFPETKVVLLVRHPCAVTDSRLRLGWRDDLDELMLRRDLVRDHLSPFEAEVSSSSDAFERSVYLWCIENYVPLVQLGGAVERGEVLVLRYEDLITTPHTELKRLFSYLGTDVPRGLADEIAKLPGDDLIDGWKERVPRVRRERAFGILRSFGLEALYGEDGVAEWDGGAGVTVRTGR